MKSLFVLSSFLFTVSAQAGFDYVCEPTMSNPDRTPWILHVEGDTLAMGANAENLKSAQKMVNPQLGWLKNYDMFGGEVEQLFPEDRYVRIYIKPELATGGVALSEGGTGGWMAISRGPGWWAEQTEFLCRVP